MTPKNWKKNVYEFKEEYIVLRVYNGDIEYKCFIDYEDYKVDKKGVPIKTFKKLEDAIKYKESHEIQT